MNRRQWLKVQKLNHTVNQLHELLEGISQDKKLTDHLNQRGLNMDRLRQNIVSAGLVLDRREEKDPYES